MAGAEMDRVLGCKCASLRIATNGWIHSESIRLRNDKIRKRQTMINNRHLCRCSCGTGRAPPGETSEELEHYHNHIHHYHNHHHHDTHKYYSMLLKPSKSSLQIVIILALVIAMGGSLNGAAASHQELIESISPFQHQQQPQQQQQPQNADQEQPVYSYSLPPVSEQDGSKLNADDMNNRDEDEPPGQAELDFKMMNVAHERLQAVRTLLNATRQQIISASAPEPASSLGNSDNQHNHQQLPHGRAPSAATGSSLHCTHKGRQYANGQSVPIQDQPCLNCTCRMAILQCYLRVCPPIVSLEAHKRRLQASGRVLPDERQCRMVKEAHQCCPVMKCDDDDNQLIASNLTSSTAGPEARNVVAQQSSLVGSATTMQQQQSSSTTPFDQTLNKQHQLAQRNTHGDHPHHHQLVAGSGPNHFDQAPLVAQPPRRAADNNDQLQQSASSMVHTTTTIMPFDNLPKLTVINGPAGQRDSILLITSNPQSIGLNAAQYQHQHQNHFESARFQNKSSNATNALAPFNAASTGDQEQRQLVSSAPIIEALLETIYSSAAKQLSGLNLQGSCMINGSLYFEGSAVLPESGSAQCQYCYCIRQKVMCVKPRCHLMISGCTPKYNNEFACCPTSYSCQSSIGGPTGGRGELPNGGSALARLTSFSPSAAGPSSPLSSSEGLQARLSAVLEAALARVTRNSSAADFLLQQQQAPPKMLLTTSANNELPDLNEPLTPRQIDGGQSSSSASSASLSNKLDGQDNSLEMMLNSMLEDKSTNIDSNQAATTQTTAAPTSMPTSTTTTTTSTTTTAKPTTSSTTTTSTTTTPAPTTTTTTTTTSTTAEPTTAKDSPTTIIKQPAEEEQPGEDDDDEEVDKAQPPPSLTTTSSSTTTTAKLNLEANQPRKPTLIEKKLTSVSNFLEPMNKLGPHMNTPTIPSGCMENGRSYTIGEQIPTLEPCKHCYCGPEGLKECRIVDCQVEGGHDCKPVTQEGHCCPIRYECPPRLHRPAAAANQGGSLDAPSALAAFNQCKSANGMDNCRNDSGAPMPKSNRLVDQVDEPFNGILEPLGPTDQMQQQQEQPQNGSMNSLREELEHFIMRIRPNQTGAVPTASGAQFEGADQYQMLGPPNGGGINNDTTRQDYDSVRPADVSQASVGGSGGGGDGVTGTTIASDPITIPTGMLGIPSIEPETIENLTHNLNNNLVLTTLDPFENTLPVGQPQTGARIYSTSNNNNQSVDNYTLNNPTTESSTPPARAGLHNHNVHSTNAHSLNNHTGTSDDYLLTTLVDNMGSTQPQAPQLSSSTAPSQPELGYSNIPTNTPLDEPIELNDERPERFANPVVMTPNVTSDPSPHGVRSLRDENAAARLRNQAGGSNSSSVYFDDEAILSLINNQHTNPSQPVVAGRSFGGSEAPANEHALGGWNTNTNNNNTNYQPIYPTIVGTSDAGEGVTPSPQQDKPTTGTPIGLEAERSLSPDTTSWLRLLPQWTKTFGQRLSGIDSFQSAANGQQPDVVTLVSQNETPQPTGSVSNQQQQQTAESTARSGRQNPFMSMLKSIIASTNQQKQQLHEQAFQPVEMMSSQHRAANLIMRPLDNELASSSAAPNQTVQFHQPAETFSSAGIQSQQQPQRTKPLSSPYEPATSSSELEIVTAPVPLEPEVFGQTRAPSVDTKDLVVVASSSFARRSDVDEAEDKGQKDDAETDDDGKTPIVSGSRAPGPAAAEGRRDQNDDLTVRYFSSLSSAGLNNNNNEHATSHRSSTPPLPQSVDDTTRMIAQPTLSGRGSTSAGSSLMHTAANTNQALKQLALSCFDPATNRTYQVNERIPKLDEPCKACHCILGKEICQPLVCPERPNESCREERRPGECCSDFLCGDGLKPVSNLGAGPSTGPIVQQGANSRVLIEPANGVEQSQHNPKSLIPTQRALVMDNQGPTNNNNNNNNNIAARLTRLFGAPEGQAPIMRTTSDSNNMLPPHILRFRSRGNENQLHVHQQPQQQPQQQPPQQQPQQPRGGNQLMFAQDQLNQFKHQMSNGNNNQNNIQVPQVNQRMGVPAPSIQQQQQQQNVRPSFFPGTSLVRPPILMHPQRFIQQQQQQQQQNFLRRNDEAGGATQMVGSNPIPFSASVSNYQFQNNRLDQTAINQINSMRFHLPNNPNPMLRPSQQVVSSTRPPAPIATSNGIPPSGFMNQQGLITTNHQNTPTNNNNNNNNMVNWGQSSQQTPSAGGAQMAGPQLPPALRTVPLFTTSQPNPNIVPQHTQPLVNSQNRMGIMPVMTSSAEQSPRVSSAVPGAPTGSDSMQSADKVTFKQSQMVSFSDPTTGFRPILGGLPTMLPPTTFQLPSSQSNRRAQETTTTTQLPTQTTTSSTEPSTVQTSTIRFSQELPVLNRVDSVRFPDLEEPNIIRSSASASTLAPQENISEHITEFGASTGSTTHTNPTTQDDTSTTTTDITTTTPSTTTTRADQNRDSSTWAMPSEAATTTSPSSSSSDSSSVSSSTTTTIASTSTQTAPSNESGLNESSSTTTTSSSPSSPPPSSSLDQTTENSASDPMDFFKVSECNIYGRVYKVGQPIDELSDQCKRCTCTSMGVDCQSKC